MSQHKISRYGWIPDLPDHRDQIFYGAPEIITNLPPKVDLRNLMPPVYDQGELGSCTANASAAVVQKDFVSENKPDFMPSRLFIYYNERRLEGTVDSDSGAMIRDAIKAIHKYGVCPETEWVYDISKFADKPTQNCYDDAVKHKAVAYSRIPHNLNRMKACLAGNQPFIIGFTVYESFESDQVATTGIVPMPTPDDSVIGGHAVVVVGYDDTTKRFLVRNSWGVGWGMQGYFTMPYEYLLDPNLADDFWVIRVVK